MKGAHGGRGEAGGTILRPFLSLSKGWRGVLVVCWAVKEWGWRVNG